MTEVILILAAIIVFITVYLYCNKEFVLGPMQKAWIKALRNNPDMQYEGVLGRIVNGKEKMCCLGMGGLITGVCEWRELYLYTKISNHDQVLGNNSFKSLGLRDEYGSPKDKKKV